MAKNKKHIPQKPDDQYPKPDISADDAWKDMFKLLETELPKNTEGQNLLKKLANTSNYLAVKAIVASLIIVAIGVVVFEKNKSNIPNPVNRASHTDIPADSASRVSHEKYESGKSTETLLNKADSIPKSEKAAENKIVNEFDDTAAGITRANEKGEKPKMERSRNDDFKNTTPSHESSVNNSPFRNRKENRIKTALSTDNELISKQIQGNKSEITVVESDEESRRTQEPKLLTRKENSSKSAEIRVTQRSLYQVSFLGNPKANSSNGLGILAKNLNKKIVTPLIIKDSTSSKQNRAFWNSLHAGLLWNANIPFQSGTSMLTQANGKKQIWPILIPGIWISKDLDSKNAILLWAKFDNQHFSNKLIQKTDFKTSDSAWRYYEKSLLVNQAFQLGIQYNRTFSERFQVGAGIAYNHTSKALLHGKETIYPVNRIQSDTTYAIKKSNLDWPLIKPSYVSGRLEAVYSFGKIKTGIALTIPITSLNDSVKTRPINGQVFLRWQIR